MGYVVVSRINYEVFFFCIQGIVPHGYLAMEGSELAEVMYANTRQMLEQYKVKFNTDILLLFVLFLWYAYNTKQVYFDLYLVGHDVT